MIPCAKIKTWHSQINKYNIKFKITSKFLKQRKERERLLPTLEGNSVHEVRNNCSTQYIWATSDNSPVIGPQWIGKGDRRHVYKDSISSSLIAGSQERISQAEQ